MQNSIEIINFQHEKSLSSLKVLVVLDLEKENEYTLNSYYQKAIDLNIYPEDLEFIDTKEFLEKYHSKEDFYRSLVYSDIILYSLYLDEYKGSFIEEYISYLDYYKEYPKLLYLDIKPLGENKRLSPSFFKRLLSYTTLVESRNIENVADYQEYIHTNGERKPLLIDYSSVDKSLPLNKRLDQEEKIYNKECKREKKLAKKLLLVGINKDSFENKLIGIYETKDIEIVRTFANSLDFIYSHKESPYFEVIIMWIDKDGEELPYLEEIPWAINHYGNVGPGEFTLEDKVEIQKALGNID